MQSKRLKLIILIPLAILLIPLIAMQFTGEIKWSIGDFIVAGVLLLGTGLLFNLIIRKVKKPKYRIAIYIVLLVLLFLFWAELAVGIFGTSFGGQ